MAAMTLFSIHCFFHLEKLDSIQVYKDQEEAIQKSAKERLRNIHVQLHCPALNRQKKRLILKKKRVILPTSFIGGPRDMKKRYLDAMSLVQKFGKPDLFITMTCNQSWPEIKENMLESHEVQNRPDLIARVFHAKLEIMKQELFKKQIFGEVAAYTYVIEFQKRGLPHAHFLIILKPAFKLYTIEDYDRIVSAEIPDEAQSEHLFRMVKKHMMHGPCDDFAKSLKCTYKEFPEHFVWYPSSKSWQPRKQKDSIGRVVAANPLEGERYFLRLLLLHVRAPTSYDDLKTINGVHVTTFREAAVLRGYLESNNSQDECLEEAAVYHMPYSLRRLFASLLVYFTPSNPRTLWLKFEESLSEDYNRLPNLTKNVIEFKVLHQISNFLESMGRNINSYGLVRRVLKFHDSNTNARDTISEIEIEVSEDDLISITKLNPSQKGAFDTIMQALYIKGKGCFFIGGPGGTGKTFFYQALLAEVWSKGFIALATASCGVAASILPGDRTAHSRFKIPIDMNSVNMCKISKQSALAKLIQATKLIIWDEAPMAHKTGIEGVDTLLKDLMGSSELFGSKIMVFGGDFRQVLPVVTKGSKEDFVQASLVTSYIWPQFHKLYLTDNMRAISDPEFTNYLLRIGNGLEPAIRGLKVKIPLPLLIPYKSETESIFELIKTVYLDLTAFSEDDFSLVRLKNILVVIKHLTFQNKAYLKIF
ncbi:uncharacterized protein [Coffea arabica]|uniref:ATP-dependent DNA helicase n=1 Tax=Coffea arabica TaxID=13443 RepID=A0ABM4UAI0_COFAR